MKSDTLGKVLMYLLILIGCINVYLAFQETDTQKLKDSQFTKISQTYITKIEEAGSLTDSLKLDLYKELDVDEFKDVSIDGTAIKAKKGDRVYLRIKSEKRETFKEGVVK